MKHLCLSTFLTLLMVCASPVMASGTAVHVEIQSESVSEGSIIVSTDAGFDVSTEAYQTGIVGVYQDSPDVEIVPDDSPNTKPMIKSGVGMVRVSGESGAIAVGDPITTSSTTGTGMKATKAGSIIGFSQVDWAPSAESDQTLIAVSIDPQTLFMRKDLKQIAGTAWSWAASSTPFGRILMIMAGSLLLAGIMVLIQRVTRKSLEAIARNPLASGQVRTTATVFSLSLVALSAAGLAGLWLLLR